jgi:hypothetical protein
VLVAPSSPQRFDLDCHPIIVPLPFEVAGCGATGGVLDSAWVTGSQALVISDPRGIAHGLALLDSIQITYVPGDAFDTSVLHVRYNLGAGVRDTTIEVIGRIQFPLPSRVLQLPASPSEVLLASCSASDTVLPLGIAGCPLGSGELDSVWISGSHAFVLSGTVPRNISEVDALAVHYDPASNENADTAFITLRYDIGSGPRDTTIEVIGTVASPLVAQPLVEVRESSSAYYSALDTLGLQLAIPAPANADSLWELVTDLSATVAYDRSNMSVVQYLPPAGWSLVSFTAHVNSFDIEIKKKAGTVTAAFNAGKAIFRPSTTAVGASWVTIPVLTVAMDGRNYSLCVTENEDNHWAVKTLGLVAESVAPEAPAISVRIYPNPAEGELFIENSSSKAANVTLFDALGRAAFSAEAGSGTTTLDIHSLAPGIYFVRGVSGVTSVLVR